MNVLECDLIPQKFSWKNIEKKLELGPQKFTYFKWWSSAKKKGQILHISLPTLDPTTIYNVMHVDLVTFTYIMQLG